MILSYNQHLAFVIMLIAMGISWLLTGYDPTWIPMEKVAEPVIGVQELMMSSCGTFQSCCHDYCHRLRCKCALSADGSMTNNGAMYYYVNTVIRIYLPYSFYLHH